MGRILCVRVWSDNEAFDLIMIHGGGKPTSRWESPWLLRRDKWPMTDWIYLLYCLVLRTLASGSHFVYRRRHGTPRQISMIFGLRERKYIAQLERDLANMPFSPSPLIQFIDNEPISRPSMACEWDGCGAQLWYPCAAYDLDSSLSLFPFIPLSPQSNFW